MYHLSARVCLWRDINHKVLPQVHVHLVNIPTIERYLCTEKLITTKSCFKAIIPVLFTLGVAYQHTF